MSASLLDLNIFERKCVLTDIDIKLSTRIENGVKQLLALVTEDGNIVLHYNYGGLPSVLKHLPWFTDSEKTIENICFDPSATWLLVITNDASLYIIPALSIVDPKQKIDCKWSLNDVTYFPRHEKTPNIRPTCIVWWQTLDSNQNAILGHEDGTISFVSLTDGQNIGVCSIGSPVKLLNICHDNSAHSVTLLITNSSRKQWRLLLENPFTGFTWSPDRGGNKIQTAFEYAIMNANGHVYESKTSRSRLQGLKNLSVEKISFLRQKLAERKAQKGNGTNSESISEDQKSNGSNDSSSSPSDSNIPEKLSYICETFLSPQFARNRDLFAGYYRPSSILTIHGVDMDVLPLFIHKLFPECWDILVTDRFFFIVNEQLDCLSVVSCQYSETRLDGDNEFNVDSLLSEFKFTENERILSIYKVADLSLPSDHTEDSSSSKKVQKTFVLAKSESELNIRRPKIDTCVVVTNRGVYKIELGCSVIKKFVHLVTEELLLEKAERLAIMFGLCVQQLLEYAGDLLLSQERFKHAISLYRLSKCRLLKSVLKFAVSGHCQELLSYITVCLNSTHSELSISTKNHLSNFAIMSYTELLLRSSPKLIDYVLYFKRFIDFLAHNEYYDEVLAVNVICQTALWWTLRLLGKIRYLAFDIIEVLCKTMKNPPIDRSTLLNELDFQRENFNQCISDSMFLQCIVSKPQYSKIFLNYIKENINNFSSSVLKRLSNSLDPSQPVAWPIISKIFQKHKCHQSSSLDSTLDSVDSEPPDELLQSTNDLIETFIYVLIVLIHRKKIDNFDINLLNLVEIVSESQGETFKSPPPVFAHPKPRILSSGYCHVGLVRNNNLFTWGSASAGCLGFGPMVTKYSLPQQVDLLNSYQVEVISVSCGKNHTVTLTNFGVYTWGSNVYGQLGIGSVVHQASYPALVEALSSENIIDISAGQYHSLALTMEGKVYSWGWGVHGQLGHGNVNDIFKPKQITYLSDKTITQISAGHAHSIVLSSEGVVYSFGSNSFGQLGNGTAEKSSTPVQILLNDKVTLIATNYFHNLAVSIDNKVYVWGASPQVLRHQVHNYKRIRLTQQYDENSEPPPPVDWSLTTPFSIDNHHLFPALVPTDNVDGQIVQVSTGCNHSALLTKDGSLYAWGQNFDGQIGNGTRTEVFTPTLIKIDPLNTLKTGIDQPLKCIYVSCGSEYTVAVDYFGKVLAWGNNSKAQLGKICDEDDRTMEGKMILLKNTKRFLKIPKTSQNPANTPKEIPNIPTMHITYRTSDKCCSSANRTSAYYFYPLRNIDNHISNKLDTYTQFRRSFDLSNDTSDMETIYLYGQRTLHYALQTYFGFYDTEFILHKCVDYKNYQAASKISYLDGHFSDSLGFQLTCFKVHMDTVKWQRQSFNEQQQQQQQQQYHIDNDLTLTTNAETPFSSSSNNDDVITINSSSSNTSCFEKTIVASSKPQSIAATATTAAVNQVSVISSSCSLESIKQFNDDLYSQGGCEEMCGDELAFYEQKITKNRDLSIDNLNARLENIEQIQTATAAAAAAAAQSVVDVTNKINLKTELIGKLEFNKNKTNCEKLVVNTGVDINSGLSNLNINANNDVDDVDTADDDDDDDTEQNNTCTNDSAHAQKIDQTVSGGVEFSNDMIRKTVINYVESLDVDIINESSHIPNLSDMYKNNTLTHEFQRLCPVPLQSSNDNNTSSTAVITDITSSSSYSYSSSSDSVVVDNVTLKNNRTNSYDNVIELASKIVEFYCSRPQILDNHILIQNILIKCMQFWLSNNLPVDVLESILLKNMEKYFYPLSILLFCKNFNNNLGEGMVKDGEAKKSQKSFEFLKQLSTKFCLQLCSMVLQNVNKA